MNIGDDREKIAAEAAASMPDEPAELLNLALESVSEFHAGVMVSDQNKIVTAAIRYEAVIWKMNGGKFFGCFADEEAAGKIVQRHCEAPLGQVPLWGQSGKFLIEVEGIRAAVEFRFWTAQRAHFSFHVVDLDRLFISETGYRSHFEEVYNGMTVDEVAIAIFNNFLGEKRLEIAESSREWLINNSLSWIENLAPDACRSLSIPSGFVLVDVILPSYKAYIVRKWAKQAQKNIDEINRNETRSKEHGGKRGKHPS